MAQKSDSRQERIAWIDMAKGYGILCVLYSHLCTGYTPSKWMFTFHIPLFFFLSGFVFSAKRPFGEFVRRKVKTLIVPYFTLAIPLLLFEGFFVVQADTVQQWIAKLAIGLLIQRRQWTLWYLACLFCLNLLFYGIVKAAVTLKKIGAVSFALAAAGIAYVKMGGPVLPWNLDACFTALPFFFGGYLCKEKYACFREKMQGKRSVVAAAALGIINILSGMPVIFGNAEGLNIYGNTYGFLPLTYLSAFAGIGCVVLVSHWFAWKPIQYLGANSLLYFAWHQSLMMHLLFVFWQKTGINVAAMPTAKILGIRFLELLAMLAVLTVCNEILSRTKLKFMLGKG